MEKESFIGQYKLNFVVREKIYVFFVEINGKKEGRKKSKMV